MAKNNPKTDTTSPRKIPCGNCSKMIVLEEGKSRLPIDPDDPCEKCPKCDKHHPFCLAHKRRGSNVPENTPFQPCFQSPSKMSATGKCRNHGGETPSGPASANFKDGKFAKYSFFKDQNFVGRIEMLAGDSLENLEETLLTIQGIQTLQYEQLDTGESTAAWMKLKEAVYAYEDDIVSRQPYHFGMVKKIVLEGLGNGLLIKDIQSTAETERKLVETIEKTRLGRQEKFTREQFDMMLRVLIDFLINSLLRHVTDRKEIAAIEADFRILLQDGNGAGNTCIK